MFLCRFSSGQLLFKEYIKFGELLISLFTILSVKKIYETVPLVLKIFTSRRSRSSEAAVSFSAELQLVRTLSSLSNECLIFFKWKVVTSSNCWAPLSVGVRRRLTPSERLMMGGASLWATIRIYGPTNLISLGVHQALVTIQVIVHWREQCGPRYVFTIPHWRDDMRDIISVAIFVLKESLVLSHTD